MPESEWERVESLFHEALGLPEERRDEFLVQACDGNQTLYLKVSNLLSHHCTEEQFHREVDVAKVLEELEFDHPILQDGQQLGRYEDMHLVGRGGMGEVYLARDSRLGRKVAIKILPQEFLTIPGGIERLRREARVISALETPNIVTVYDFDAQGGMQFMVTEFVEGVSLRELIGHLSVAQAIRYARQIGEALNAAHARGIIHRDIKPENVMVRASDDCVKVLDFGLAKLAPSSPETGKSLYDRLTRSSDGGPGGLAGTVSYMSPEQVREQPVDARTDIWSWGVVLYEMLAGTRPFTAPTTPEIFVAILHTEPQPPNESAQLNDIVCRALARNLEDRYPTIEEALKDLARIPGSETQSVRQRARKSPLRLSRSRQWLVLAGAVPILAALLFFGFMNVTSPHRFRIGNMTHLTTSGNVVQTAISPNGTYLAYSTEDRGGQSLNVLQLGTNTIIPIHSTIPGEIYSGITFSRDSSFIYYVLERANTGKLYRVPLLGGEPELTVDDVDSPISFAPNGNRFVFLRIDARSGDSSLILYNREDKKEEILLTLHKKLYFLRAPVWSPDGKTILCGVQDNSGNSQQIKIMSIRVADRQSRMIGPEPWLGMYRPVWLNESASIAVSALSSESEFSKIWEVSLPGGKATPITNDTQRYRDLDVTSNASQLVAIQVERSSILGIMEFNQPQRYGDVPKLGRQIWDLAWTPSGKIISQRDFGGHPEFWEIEPSSGKTRQLTFDGATKQEPAVSRDGQTMVYTSAPGGTLQLWRQGMDGRSQAVRLTSGSSLESQAAISPDGRWVIYTSSESGFQTLWKAPIVGGAPVQLMQQRARRAAISPDGKQIACEYSEHPENTGWTVTVLDSETLKPLRSFPKIPTSDNDLPVRWSADGKNLLYVVTDGGISNIWSQSLNDSSRLQLTHFSSERIFAFAPSPDGRSLGYLHGLETSDVVLVQAAK
jgi:serine/threonine protein kinase